MRKLLFLLIPFWLQAQDMELSPVFQSTPGYATVLNGSNYWSNAAPTNMDLNGAETLVNPTFNSNITGWTQDASITAAQKTNSNRVHSGAGSYGAKNSTSVGKVDRAIYPKQNPYATITWTSAANPSKWTLEAWVYMPAADSVFKVALILCDTAGSALVTGSTQTITANTWTKVVVNGAYSGVTTGVAFKINWVGPGRSDSLYVDDVSLTQAYDAFGWTWLNELVNGTEAIFDVGNVQTANNRFIFFASSANHLTVKMTDSSANTAIDSALTLPMNSGHFVGFTFSRTGNLNTYVDQTVSAGVSASAVGKIQNVRVVTLGYKTSSSSVATYFSGWIGEGQIVKCTTLPSDITSTFAAIYSGKTGFPSYTNSTPVDWWKWSAPGVDLSGTGNTLTSTGSPGITVYNP